MPEKTRTEIAIEGFKQRATFFANLSEDTVTRRDLGSANLESLAEDAKALKEFAGRILVCSWKGIPPQVIENCSNRLEQLKNPINQIKDFNILNSNNVAHDRQVRISNFQTQWFDVYSFIVPHLCFAESVDRDADTQKNLITKFIADADAAKQNIISLESSVKADQERMKKLVEEIETMARRSGVTDQAVHFKTLADRYLIGAIFWAIVAIVSGVVLYVYVKDLHATTADTPVALIASLIPRLITVTLLSTALIFCIRNFSSLMHNVIVNRHRQTALSTFNTFVSSTDDPGTRNAVLIQSTQAIFSPQPSGYLKTDTEMPQMNQVTEIVRGIAGKPEK